MPDPSPAAVKTAPFRMASGLFDGLPDAVLRQPDNVSAFLSAAAAAGASILRTHSARASRPALAALGLAEHTNEINWTAAQIAVAAAKPFHATVAGVVHPLPPDPARTAPQAEALYQEQIGALLDGRVDQIWLEAFASPGDLRTALYAFRSLDSRPVLCALVCGAAGNLDNGAPAIRALLNFHEEGATVVGLQPPDGVPDVAALFGGLAPDPDIPRALFAGAPPTAELLERHGIQIVAPSRPWTGLGAS